MRILFIINDAPYGTEKAYNALRCIVALQDKQPDAEIFIFLLSDAVGCALANQSTPQGYYNIGSMLERVIKRGAKVKICGTCITARGMNESKLVEGVEVSGMSDMVTWILESDKIVAF
jgi:uncharacterized protein involved in oxidation of intracellular sulfur